MRIVHLAVLLSLLSISLAGAQTIPTCTPPCTQQQLLNDVQTQFPDQTSGGITPATLRQFLNNVIYSMLPTAPLAANSPACYYGTTGLTNTCTAALGLTQGGTGATTQPGAANNIFPAVVRTGDITYWNGTQWVTLAGNNTTPAVLQETGAGVPSWVTSLTGLAFPTPTRAGDIAYFNGTAWVSFAGNNTATAVLQESSAGVPSWATNLAALSFPTPTRAGDIVYWSGTAWVALAGNNSGTNFLSENPSGIPAWGQPTIPPAVTSVTCGQGLSGGTITTTGTCAQQTVSYTNSLGADVALNNTANFFDGPSVAQGTSGTWWAAGTVTLTDTAAATFYCKLWDGTTVIASSGVYDATVSTVSHIALSGVIATPAGNIRMSCKDTSGTTGSMKFNMSGASKDSTVNAMRLQ